MIARLIDSRLQLVAELRQTFEPLLIGQRVIQRVLERHGVSVNGLRVHQKVGALFNRIGRKRHTAARHASMDVVNCGKLQGAPFFSDT